MKKGEDHTDFLLRYFLVANIQTEISKPITFTSNLKRTEPEPNGKNTELRKCLASLCIEKNEVEYSKFPFEF